MSNNSISSLGQAYKDKPSPVAESLVKGVDSIPYRPELNELAGSVTGTIL